MLGTAILADRPRKSDRKAPPPATTPEIAGTARTASPAQKAAPRWRTAVTTEFPATAAPKIPTEVAPNQRVLDAQPPLPNPRPVVPRSLQPAGMVSASSA